MANPIEQLDVVIAKKREELKELLLARDSLQHLAKLVSDGTMAITVQVDGRQLELDAPPEEPEATPAPPQALPVDKAARKSAIAKAAADKQVSGVKVGPTGRKSFSAAFKLKVLEAIDKADTQAEVCRKFDVYPSNIITWLRQREEGKLLPSAQGPEVSSLELRDDQDDSGPVEVVAPVSPFFNLLEDFLPHGERMTVPFRDYLQ